MIESKIDKQQILIQEVDSFDWHKYRTAPTLSDIKLGKWFSNEGNQIKTALLGLAATNDIDELEEYYNEIDNTALVQGALYEVSLPLTEYLVRFLPFSSNQTKFYMLDLLCMISSGELSECERQLNNVNLINQCILHIIKGNDFYVQDGIESFNTELAQFYCELILFCGEHKEFFDKKSLIALTKLTESKSNIPAGLVDEATHVISTHIS